MYALIVGEGGVSADYFLNKMSVSEAEDYVLGLNRRARQAWEQTRLLARVVVKSMTGEDWEMRLPWDDEEEKTERTEEELDQLREKAKMMEKIVNREPDENEEMDSDLGK